MPEVWKILSRMPLLSPKQCDDTTARYHSMSSLRQSLSGSTFWTIGHGNWRQYLTSSRWFIEGLWGFWRREGIILHENNKPNAVQKTITCIKHAIIKSILHFTMKNSKNKCYNNNIVKNEDLYVQAITNTINEFYKLFIHKK